MGHVVNLNKPPGITSHKAVSKVKKMLGVKKAGHAGTLDPLAEGVLLICTGEATKISRFLAGLDKEYLATLRLGQKTDTLDAEGTVLHVKETAGIHVSAVEEILKGFVGEIEQVPPMYSAVKTGGQTLYKLARKGITVERRPRVVRIIDARLVEYNNPFLTIRVQCSKGTYIRALADDIGDVLGVGAYLHKLIRTRVSCFDIKDSVGLEPEEIRKALIDIDAALNGMPEIVLGKEAFLKARNGVPVSFSPDNVENYGLLGGADESEFFRLKDFSGKIFAIGKVRGGLVGIERMFLTKPKEVY